MANQTNTYLALILLGLIAAGLIYANVSSKTTTPSPAPVLATPTPISISNTPAKEIMDVDQLIIEDIATGSGVAVKPGDTVVMHYTGTLMDGTKFDSSYDRNQPATFGLNQVIKGWTEGLQYMPVGSKFIFYIPSDLGYGTNPPPGSAIKPGSLLIFEVELLKINK